MRIDSSNIGMESERTYSATSVRASKVTITASSASLADGTGNLFGDLLSPEGEEANQAKEKETPGNYIEKTLEEMRAKVEAFRNKNVRTLDLSEEAKQLRDIRQQCLDYLIELFFPSRKGMGSYVGSQNDAGYDAGTDVQSESSLLTGSGSALYTGILQQKTASMHTFTFSRQYYYEETENTTFTTQGTVKCADGRELNFNLNVEMSRSFQEYYEENYFMAQASLTDPLVINLEGNIAELSDQTFFFDIDADGKEDEINRLAAGSGYLALDKNGDGVINDGSELFGTKSGDGFADLAKYDEDGNGFIDEGDAVFSKLKIWIMDKNGEQKLVSLLDAGVGAIGLQNAATDFKLADDTNQTKGMIRKTGFFLYENGGAGTVQHVDVARYNQAG